MGRTFRTLSADLRSFIAAQSVFFVATAPRADDGHINVSPKGLDTFAVLDDASVAYLDLTGSGNETAAHVLENGRITVMFCAFSGAPRILRLYGSGRIILPEHDDWARLRLRFGVVPGERQIVVVDVQRIQVSCGFGVPLMEEVGPRDTLVRWAEKKGAAGLEAYRAEKNAVSMDGLRTPFAED
jgi:hypothetical protein